MVSHLFPENKQDKHIKSIVMLIQNIYPMKDSDPYFSRYVILHKNIILDISISSMPLPRDRISLIFSRFVHLFGNDLVMSMESIFLLCIAMHG